MTILGIGHDIANLSRFTRLLHNSRLHQRILHPVHEYPYFQTLPEHKRAVYLASAWSIKEAVFKSLPSEMQKGFTFKEWYRFKNPDGRPGVAWDHGKPKFWVSLSHDGDYVSSFIIREDDPHNFTTFKPNSHA